MQQNLRDDQLYTLYKKWFKQHRYSYIKCYVWVKQMNDLLFYLFIPLQFKVVNKCMLR